MTDPFDDASYRRFVLEAARACRCCQDCSECPCGGCLAGGLCDDAECHCDDDATDQDDPAGGDDGYDSDYEDQP